MMTSGQHLPIVLKGDLNVEFVHPSEDKPGRDVQPTDVLHTPGLQSNLLSLRAMHAKGFSFCGGKSKTLFDEQLIFPVMGNLY